MPQARARDIKFARILSGIKTIIIVNHNGAALALLVEIALAIINFEVSPQFLTRHV
jgi:hypothetical protein